MVLDILTPPLQASKVCHILTPQASKVCHILTPRQVKCVSFWPPEQVNCIGCHCRWQTSAPNKLFYEHTIVKLGVQIPSSKPETVKVNVRIKKLRVVFL